ATANRLRDRTGRAAGAETLDAGALGKAAPAAAPAAPNSSLSSPACSPACSPVTAVLERSSRDRSASLDPAGTDTRSPDVPVGSDTPGTGAPPPPCHFGRAIGGEVGGSGVGAIRELSVLGTLAVGGRTRGTR